MKGGNGKQVLHFSIILFLFYSLWRHSLTVKPWLTWETYYVTQAGLNLTESHLPLPSECYAALLK